MPLDCAPPEATWRARLVLAFERRGERSVLATREHEGPLVVQKPLYPEGPEVCHAIVVHPPGGIAGGDELVMEVAARTGASALLTTPGAAKWYRSAGPWARQDVRIAAAAGSRLEWLPQETIVYDGARARITWSAELEAGARLIAWDIICLGRIGSGERFERGTVRLDTQIRREGCLVWLERGSIDAGSAQARCAAGLGGYPVFGTLVVAAPAIDDAWLGACREHVPTSGQGCVTRLPGLLVARYLGDSTQAARAYFTSLWRSLREEVFGVAPMEPRIWRT